MKRPFLCALAFLSSALLFSCSDSDDDSESDSIIEVETSLILSVSDTLQFSNAGGSEVFTVTTNSSDLSVTSDVDWISSSFNFSQGQATTVTLSVSKYDVEDETTDYDPRTAVVTVTAGSVSKEIVVKQRPIDYLEPNESTRINGVAQAYRVDYQGSTWVLNFETNGDYTLDLPWWIVESEKENREDGTKYTVAQYLEILANYDDEERTGEVVVTLGEASFTCTVVQSSTEFDFSAVNTSASEIAAEMKLGWTFTDGYLSDGLSHLSNGMLDVLKENEINIVKIPCPFVSDGSVNEFWLAGVKSAVEYVTNAGMYAVVTVDDDGWLSDNLSVKDTAEVFSTYTTLWNSIASELTDFDYHVIFQAYGDIDATASEFPQQVYGRLNALFIQTVRRNGGNNYKRCLITPVYDPDNDFYLAVATNDPTEDRLMVSFNYFQPTDYAASGATKKLWGEQYASYPETEYCSDVSASNIKLTFSNLLSKYTKTPIILSSFGTVSHTSSDGDVYSDSEAVYANTVAKAAYDNAHIVPIIADDNQIGVGYFGCLVRDGASSYFSRATYLSGIIAGAEGSEVVLGDDEEEEVTE